MLTIGKNEKTAEFEKLYFDNYNYLCQSIYRFIKDENITKDIAQDVFMKYWQKIHELRITESPKSYLYKACINQALNFLKEKERRESRENTYSDEAAQSDNSPDRPDAQLETNETSQSIAQAIDQLPPACRKVFLLSRYEEKSYKEIASLLEISVNTVEKHIGKALKTLRSALLNN